ncbi:MAG: hypothetical protein NDJ89_05795 [Oligoflexia bacterium]|nr:hypothetical protein [Oligoflexia bacterium]
MAKKTSSKPAHKPASKAAHKPLVKLAQKAVAKLALKSSLKKKKPEVKAKPAVAKPSAKVTHPKKGLEKAPTAPAKHGGAKQNGVKAEAKIDAKALKVAHAPKAAPIAAAKPLSAKAARQAAKAAADAEAVCREVACEGLATSAGYCRLHYIKNWKKIKRKEVILKEGKLNQYIEELVVKYPDKYLEAIRQDLASDKDFAKVIYDLDLDESVDEFDVEGENADAIIDSIKRDFDDEGDTGF